MALHSVVNSTRYDRYWCLILEAEQVELISWLLNKGALPARRNSSNATPLHTAAASGRNRLAHWTGSGLEQTVRDHDCGQQHRSLSNRYQQRRRANPCRLGSQYHNLDTPQGTGELPVRGRAPQSLRFRRSRSLGLWNPYFPLWCRDGLSQRFAASLGPAPN